METFTIAGRKFKAIGDSTLRHDIWMRGEIEKAGLSRIAITKGESETEFMERLVMRANDGGDIFLLLGGAVIPTDMDPKAWSVDTAIHTAAFLGAVTAPEDKAAVQGLIVSALFPFFVQGLSSLAISPKSFLPENEAKDAGTEVQPITEIGAKSSANSRTETMSTPSGSWIGRCARWLFRMRCA